MPNHVFECHATLEPQPAQDAPGVSQQLRCLLLQFDRQLDEDGAMLLEDALRAAREAERQIARQNDRIRYLEELSNTDELTGLLNRRGFQLELDRALVRARRHGETGVLLLCDLNRFKPVNDTFGHPAGDAVLRAVSGLLRDQTRRSDYVARLGGDEFAVLMTDTSTLRAEAQVGRLQSCVNRLHVAWQESEIPVSAGFGQAAYDHGSQPERLLAQADRALYGNKRPRLREAV